MSQHLQLVQHRHTYLFTVWDITWLLMMYHDASIQCHCTLLIYNSPSFPIALCLCVPPQWAVGVAEVHEKEHLVRGWERERWQRRRVQLPSCCWFISPTTQCSTQQLAQPSNCIREKLNVPLYIQGSVICAWHSIKLACTCVYRLYINFIHYVYHNFIYLISYIN